MQEQYWSVCFKNDCPESVKDVDEIMGKFEEKIRILNKDDEWEKTFAAGGVLGNALYESEYVQDEIKEEKNKKNMHDAQELDAGIGVIEEIVEGVGK